MKNAIVKLGFCLLLFCSALTALAVGPKPTITPNTTPTQRGSSLVFTVDFGEAVTDFDDAGDINLTGAGFAGASAVIAPVSSSVYTVTVTGHTITGPVTLTVTAGAATAAGGATLASDPQTINFDGDPEPKIEQHGTQVDPTVGETSAGFTTIKFYVDFQEPINFSTLTAGDFNLSDSDSGLGSPAVDAGSFVAEIPNQKYSFTVTIPATATGNKHLKVKMDAGKVADAFGNLNKASTSTDNDVTYAGVAPKVTGPVKVDVTRTSITVGGEIIDDGGLSSVKGGTLLKDGTGIDENDNRQEEQTGEGTFDHTYSGLTEAHEYRVSVYGNNGVGGNGAHYVIPTEISIWTLSTAPTTDSNISNITAVSDSSISITFSPLSSMSGADGLMIVRHTADFDGNDLNEGVAPGQAGQATLHFVADLTAGSGDNGTTVYVDKGLNPDTEYYYAVIPYNAAGSNVLTTNYKDDFASPSHIKTLSKSSRIALDGASPATIDYKTKTGTISAAADGITVMNLRIYDGTSSADGDAVHTDLKTLRVRIMGSTGGVAHHTLVQQLALVKGGTLITGTPNAPDMNGDVTFTISPSNTIQANEGTQTSGGDQFKVIASFKTTGQIDGAVIRLKVMAATTYSASSNFTAHDAGGADTGPTNNAIAVIASKFDYTGRPSSVNVNQEFGFTATLMDINNNIDTNIGGNLALSSSGLTGTTTKPIVAGVATWGATDLKFTTAGNPKTVNLDANNWSGPGPSTDGSFTIVVNSLGVSIKFHGADGDTPGGQSFCFNTAATNANHASYQQLYDIKVEESDAGDFAIGTGQTFALLLPSGFIFDNVAPTVTPQGDEIANLTFLSFSSSKDIVRIKYDITGNTDTDNDGFTISGLMVKYIGTTPVTDAPILRVGGTAVQEKNADTDEEPHGLISAASGAIDLDFVNGNGGSVAPQQTGFSKDDPPVILQAFKGGLPAASADVSFSGEGVAFDGADWKFYPQSLDLGTYPITYTYTDHAGAEGCISTLTKTYTIATSVINGLNKTYCEKDPMTTLGAPTSFSPPFGLCTIVILGTPFLYSAYQTNIYVYKWRDYSQPGEVWVDLIDADGIAPGMQFNPGYSGYTASLNSPSNPNPRNLEVVPFYQNFCTLAYDGKGMQIANVKINPNIKLAITPLMNHGVCQNDAAPTKITGTNLDINNGYDEIWSSQPYAPASRIVGVGLSAGEYFLTPSVANGTTSDKIIQINYQHKEPTGCTSEVARTVTVYAKPVKMTSSQIKVRGQANQADTEFCYQESMSPFTTTAVTGIVYKWTYNPDIRGIYGEGVEFWPSPSDFVPAGIPTPVGSVARYKVQQIEHRKDSTAIEEIIPGFFFPVTRRYFEGCASDPLDLSATIVEPTTIQFGPKIVVCEGNPVVLDDLGAEIIAPNGEVLDGTWSSSAGGAFAPNPTFSTVGNTYTPVQIEKDKRLVTLTLTSEHPAGPCPAATADVVVDISPTLTISFPDAPSAIMNLCADEKIEIKTELSTSIAFDWIRKSGLGGFPDPGGSETPVTTLPVPLATTGGTTPYIPNATELNTGGTVVVTVKTADPDGPTQPCQPVQRDIEIRLSKPARIEAGADFDVCTGPGPLKINLNGTDPGSGTSSAHSWTWTSTGAGSITDPSVIDAEYTSNDAFENPGLTTVPGTRQIKFTITTDKPGDFPGQSSNVCPAGTDDVVVTIHNTPTAPTTLGGTLQPDGTTRLYEVCVNVDAPTITGDFFTFNEAKANWYDNRNNAAVSNATAFKPTAAVNQEKLVSYWLNQSFDKTGTFAGCHSDSTEIKFQVHPLPIPSFSYVNRCFGDTMQFSDLSQLDQTHGPRSIVSWQWDFDDGTAQTLPGSGPIPPNTIGNSGTYEEPGHVFAKTGTFRVKLKLVTSNGCSAEFQDSNVPVGPVPKTDFNPTLICDQDNTLFASSHGISPAPLPGDLTYAWEFDDAATGVNNTSTVANPTHKFTGVDSYQVKLTITTNLGCDSTITKTTSILPFIQDGEFPYIESFESSNHGWVAEGHLDGALSQLTSWSKQPAPAGGIPKDPNEGAGDAFWATHTNVSPGVFYYNNERSILYGPCVDMTKLDRPVIAMDYFADLEHGFDGVYVEYLDEGSVGSDWTRLGDISTGLNWYTDGSIDGLSADGGIGQNVSQYGWTRATPAWTTARYNLNDLSGMDRVRFRLVFGSNKTLVNSDIYDGFAMDNFKLESRNRLVLVENFTSNSTSSTVSDNEDAYIDFPDDAPADEVVKIEYHTGIPAATGDPKDPIFEQNPMDPSGRASFYGLSSMPRAYIDGFSDNSGSENNGMFHGAWANKHYSTESLKTSPIDITIGVDPVIENGVMNIAGTVVAREIDLKANTYSLYVAVVEQDGAGDNTFVLRKMLPSASGVKVPATARGGSFNFSQSWAIDAAYLGSNPELRAVAFIQSDIEDPSEHANKRSVRQVLQAAYSSTIDLQDIPLTTGLETPFLEQTAMYPNPADKIVKIELPGATKTGVEVNVIDQLGRSVARSAIRAGEKSTSINIGDLAGSVYIVQLNENGVYTTRKLVVTHRN